jgi:hypothetical protein
MGQSKMLCAILAMAPYFSSFLEASCVLAPVRLFLALQAFCPGPDIHMVGIYIQKRLHNSVQLWKRQDILVTFKP